MRALFKKLDVDGNGFIRCRNALCTEMNCPLVCCSALDLRKCMRAIGEKASDIEASLLDGCPLTELNRPQIDAMLKMSDSSGDGQLSLSAFEALFATVLAAHTRTPRPQEQE